MKRLALLLACASGPAVAQPPDAAARPTAPSSGAIVVEGRRDTRAETRAQVRRVSPYPSDFQALARLNKPACFAISGLPRDFAIEMANRMVDDAEAAGVAMAGAGCQPNVRVLVVDGSSEDFRRARRLIAPDAGDDVPVLARTITATRSRDGDRIRTIPGSNTVDTLKIPQSTHIGIYTRTDIDEALVIFRRDAVIGKSAGQLADYAAMRALAQARDAPSRSGSTILSLFDPSGGGPDGLTAFDASYLKALYAGPANVAASVALGTITRKIHDGK